MVNRLSSCDSDRLRSYLDDDLSPGGQADLAGHLDHCTTCQKALERLAAGSRLWHEIRHLGGAKDSPTTGRIPSERPSRNEDQPRPTFGRDKLELDFLTPSDDPAYLGRLGPYEVIGILGQGGMGIVLKAFDPSLSRVVAIKILAPQMAASGAARRRFFREAKAAAAVVHDHVVAIYAVDTDPEEQPPLPRDALHRRPLAPGADRPGWPASHRGSPADRHADRARSRRGACIRASCTATSSPPISCWRTASSASRSPTSAWPVPSTMPANPRAVSWPEPRSTCRPSRRAGRPRTIAPTSSASEACFMPCAPGHSPFRARTTMGVLRRVCDESPRPLVEINPEVPESLEAVIGRLHAEGSGLEIPIGIRRGRGARTATRRDPAPGRPTLATDIPNGARGFREGRLLRSESGTGR